MFQREIHSMTLTSDITDRLFENITAASYGLDRTFAATMRAVLPRRLPAGESVMLSLLPIGTYAITTDILVGSLRQLSVGHSYTITIAYPQDKAYGKQLLENVRESFGQGKRYFRTYTPREDLRIFYIRKLDGLFYTDGRNTLIFTDALDMRRFHVLQMMLPQYLPVLFSDCPLSAEETALLKSLGLRSHAEYERLIEDFARRLDLRSEIIRTRLRGFETAFERARAQEAEQDLRRFQEEYQTLLSRLRNTAEALRDQQILLAGLQSRIETECQSELMEYFLCNKNLSIIRVRGTELEFVVHGYADIYDEDAFDTCAGNLNSYLYKNIGVSRKGMERLYRAIFSTKEYKLRLCAAYRVDMRNNLRPLSEYTFPPESRTYLPNPHIQRFGCIGGYASRFVEYMSNRDYVGAVDQAAVSARNLNFYDSAVMGFFAQTLSATTIRCIEDRDGNLMTPGEAIQKSEEAEVCPSP